MSFGSMNALFRYMSEAAQGSCEHTLHQFSVQFLTTLLMAANAEEYIHVLNSA